MLNATSQSTALRGYVSDKSNGTVLVGANVTLRDSTQHIRGAVTSTDGYYIIPRLSPGQYVVQASFVGFASYKDTLFLADTSLVTLNISLPPGQALEEIVVIQDNGAASISAGLQEISPIDLERIPTPAPGGDLSSYLQTLPGIVSLGDRGGQLFVRGGTPSQNMVLLDGTLIYQPFHLIGFFSAFPQDLISKVDVFAGGFGARYSGRLSSVIDVRMRAGNNQAFEGSVALSPFISSYRVEGPIVKNELSFLGSFRSSVIEQTSEFLIGEPVPLAFNDLVFKIQKTGQANNQCSLTGVHTYDRGQIGDKSDQAEEFKWSNVVLAGRCSGFSPHSSVFIESNSGFSFVNNSVGDALRPERSSNAWLFNTEVHWTYPSGKHELQGGFDLQVEGGRFRLSEQFQGIRDQNDYLVGTGIYTGMSIALTDHLKIDPSIAVSYPLAYSPSLEPRLRIFWSPEKWPNHAFTGAVGVYRQTIEGINDERDIGSLFTAWVPTPINEKRSMALHVIGGWNGKMGPFSVAAEGYYKRIRNLPVPEWSVIARFTTTLTPANGNVYGLDSRIEYEQKPLYVYLGYGLSTTKYTTAQDNFGIWFDEPIQSYYPPHDRRHQLNAVINYNRGAFTASARWQYGSGLPFTQSLGTDSFIRLINLPDIRTEYGTPRFLFDRPYQSRLSAYHRLDTSVSYSFNFKPH